jgi:protein involved in temperature-dependent protein secretion
VTPTLKLGELANGSTRLADLLAEGQRSVRGDPANSKRRVMLFQLMVLSGQWDRALTQLYVIKEMDGDAADFVRTYREVVRCELFRKEVFAGGKTPLVLGEPSEWIASLTEATRLLGQGKVEQAAQMRAARSRRRRRLRHAERRAVRVDRRCRRAHGPAARPCSTASTTGSRSSALRASRSRRRATCAI